jgi:hypothetical protein
MPERSVSRYFVDYDLDAIGGDIIKAAPAWRHAGVIHQFEFPLIPGIILNLPAIGTVPSPVRYCSSSI